MVAIFTREHGSWLPLGTQSFPQKDFPKWKVIQNKHWGVAKIIWTLKSPTLEWEGPTTIATTIVFVNYSVPNVPKTKGHCPIQKVKFIVSRGWMEPIERGLWGKGTTDISFQKRTLKQMTHYVSKGQAKFFSFYVATSVSFHKLLCSF
jgi:hypothetical protein